MKQKANRLFDQKSPYLLQHAYNPVDWYPWGDHAFEQAKKEEKPVFLSIGYSTCHWCHVMEKESFEDPEVARLLNQYFISIKVDREERPDIDNIFMQVYQLMTGRGGWPLTVFLTPEKKPFFAATYIPKKARFGHIGMMELIPKIGTAWKNKRQELEVSANKIIETLKTAPKKSGQKDLHPSILDQTFQELYCSFDNESGGFGSAPKFPTPHNLFFLMRYWKRKKSQEALNIVKKTLRFMHRGGIFDQVGYGFHRYSTDKVWFLPHFEKMLYDQAMIIMACSELYQITHDPEFKTIAEEIWTYVNRDMTSADGAFFSAEDADSEGIEGKFYLWTKAEILEILPPAEANLAIKVFNIEENGNFKEEASGHKPGTNLLHLQKSLPVIAKELEIPEEKLKDHIRSIRNKLLETRGKRVRPLRDDKILLDWNGLMIAALAKASQALDDPKYANAAQKTADFILTKMREQPGELRHRYREGHLLTESFADDYSFFIWGLIELYEATYNTIYLQTAITLNNSFIELFWDKKNGGFYFTDKNKEFLIVRRKEIYDGAVPSSNSVAIMNLMRLSRMIGNFDLEVMAAQTVQAFSEDISQHPSAYTYFLCGLDYFLGPSNEVVVVGKRNAEDTQAMLKALRKSFLPNKVLIYIPSDEENPEIHKIAPFTKNFIKKNNQATAYVCSNFSCQDPIHDIDLLLKALL